MSDAVPPPMGEFDPADEREARRGDRAGVTDGASTFARDLPGGRDERFGRQIGVFQEPTEMALLCR
jgi:hypothetical protein